MPKAQLLNGSAWLLHFGGDEAPPITRNSSEVTRAISRCCFPHTENGGPNLCLSCSPPWSVGLSIQDKAMVFNPPAPQEAMRAYITPTEALMNSSFLNSIPSGRYPCCYCCCNLNSQFCFSSYLNNLSFQRHCFSLSVPLSLIQFSFRTLQLG